MQRLFLEATSLVELQDIKNWLDKNHCPFDLHVVPNMSLLEDTKQYEIHSLPYSEYHYAKTVEEILGMPVLNPTYFNIITGSHGPHTQ